MKTNINIPGLQQSVMYLLIVALIAISGVLSCSRESGSTSNGVDGTEGPVAVAEPFGEEAGDDLGPAVEQAPEPVAPPAPAPVFLKAEVSPAQSGRIEIIPAPNQGVGYKPRTHLVLEAVPAEGFEFSAWAGDAGGTANRTQVTISSDLSVMAVFSRRAPEPVVAPAPPTVAAPAPVIDSPAVVAPPEPAVAPPAPAVAPQQPVVAPPLPQPGTDQNVIFNGVRLSAQVLSALEQQYGLTVEDGEYWYDSFSGAVGQRGGPMAAFIMPGLSLGGPLRADASGGGTSVFINGREAHPVDVLSLQMLVGFIPPGRYYLDAAGNYGYEGYENFPPVGNLIQAAQAARSGGGAGGAGAGGGGGLERTPFGDVGGGSFFYPETGCSIMQGSGLSC